MQNQHPTGASEPLVRADQHLTDAWRALIEYRDGLTGDQAETADALCGAVTIVGFPIKYVLGQV